MSAIVLPLHHLVSHPRRPQPCCHSVLWGFCLLSSSLLHCHSPFSASFTISTPCAEAQLAQPGLLQPAVLPLLLTGHTEESRRMAVGHSSLPQFHMNRPLKERPPPAITPAGCNAFRGKGGESRQVHSTPHHTPCTGKS